MKLVPLERIATQTLLGIRFWDRLLERPVADGLYARAQRLNDDLDERIGRVVIGQATSSGVIAFFGLHSGERVLPDPDKQLWKTLPAARFVAVDVIDRQRRYLPMSFVVRIPLPERGAFKGQGDWLDESLLHPIVGEGEEPGVYLWSAPARPALDGFAVIYAQIVIGNGEKPAPAPYALMEVSPAGGTTYSGIADENGILRLPMPYPPVAEPVGDHYPQLQDQTFALDVHVYYQANHQVKLPGSDVPDLDKLLTQSQAQIGTHWNESDPSELQTSLTLEKPLRFGQPLILRTAIGSADAAEAESFLRIVPI